METENNNLQLPAIREDRTVTLKKRAKKYPITITKAALNVEHAKGRWGLFGNPEEKAMKEIENCLAATPDGINKREINQNASPLMFPNNEINEIRYGLENINHTILYYEKKILTGNDTDAKINYYKSQVIIYQTMRKMLFDFINHCENIYIPMFRTAKNNNEKRIADTQAIIKKMSSPENKKILENNIEARNQYGNKLIATEEQLYKQKEWATNYTNFMHERMLVCSNTLHTITDITAFPEGIADILTVKIIMPPILDITECNL